MKLTRNFAYWLLVGASLAWIALVYAAPFLEQRWGSGSLIYRFFRPVCHQSPLRSFACFGGPLAVCHRCLGLYSGFAAGLLALPHLHALRRWLLATPRRVLFFFAPMLADVLLWENVPWSRLATGLVAGFPVALFVWAAASQLTRRSTGAADTRAGETVPTNPVTAPGGER